MDIWNTRNIAHMGKVLLANGYRAASKHTHLLVIVLSASFSLLLYDVLIPCLYHRTRRMVLSSCLQIATMISSLAALKPTTEVTLSFSF